MNAAAKKIAAIAVILVIVVAGIAVFVSSGNDEEKGKMDMEASLPVYGNADGSLVPCGLEDPDKTIKDFWAIVNNPQKVSVCTLMDEDVHKQEIDGKTIVVVDVPRADRQQRPVYIDTA